MRNKAIVYKILDPSKMYAAVIDREAMVLYPPSDPNDTPICLRGLRCGDQETREEANRLVANPQEVIDYLNAGEVEYETHIRWRLLR